MNISEQWLREWVDPDTDTEGLAHQLTMAGRCRRTEPRSS